MKWNECGLCLQVGIVRYQYIQVLLLQCKHSKNCLAQARRCRYCSFIEAANYQRTKKVHCEEQVIWYWGELFLVQYSCQRFAEVKLKFCEKKLIWITINKQAWFICLAFFHVFSYNSFVIPSIAVIQLLRFYSLL